MTFKKAFEELKKIAGGKPCALEYEKMFYTERIETIRIRAYIEDIGYTDSFPTFRQVLDNIQVQIKPEKIKPDKARIADSEEKNHEL